MPTDALPAELREGLRDHALDRLGTRAIAAPVSGFTPSRLSKSDILDALAEGRVGVAYQPIVHAGTHALHHHECLIRVRDPGGAPLPAGDVVGAAETHGLVHRLDRRALRLASRAMIARPGLRLALNVSAQTVCDPRASADYLDALVLMGRAAARLTLELTETVAVADPVRAARFSARAREMGCGFAIDDFGTGFTSFRNLLAIEADSLKIDGGFVDDLATSERSRSFVRMMVEMADTFGMTTVAERVETPEIARELAACGVDYLQGYLFGRPGPLAEELRRSA